MTPQQTWTPDARHRPVVLAGASQFVRDHVARACAAAGVTAEFVPVVAEALALDPVVLLVGVDQTAGGVPGHREVIVVGGAEDEPGIWGIAAGLESSRVVILPQGSGWLAEHLGRTLNPAATGAVVGFLGAAGGCGVSTFAYWFARTAVRSGRSAVLVDGHPLNGGLDLALGLEERPGVRWHDLADVRGTLHADQLAAALPSDGGLSVLSHAARADAGGGDRMGSSGAVMDAARGAFSLSVIDLGSAASADRPLTTACDHLVVLVPSRPRGVATAEGVLRTHTPTATTVVLRGPVLDGLDSWLVADLLNRPGPLPFLPFVRGASQTEAMGRLPEFPVPRAVRKTVEAVTDAMGLQ
jgi:secretion/DNA translocation related CpaE-like protein